MNSLFGNAVEVSADVKRTDYIGGRGPLDTGVYDATVKMAYLVNSQSSAAKGALVIFDVNGQEVRETFWATNKEGKNTYEDKKTKETRYQDGFVKLDDLALLTTGKGILQQDAEEKLVKVYNFTERKELPENKNVLVDLIGKDVRIALVRQTVNKQSKGDDGVYVKTVETRDENVIEKFISAKTGKTVAETLEEKEATYVTEWAKKNEGKTRDRTSKDVGAGTAGAPPSGGQARTSLF